MVGRCRITAVQGQLPRGQSGRKESFSSEYLLFKGTIVVILSDHPLNAGSQRYP